MAIAIIIPDREVYTLREQLQDRISGHPDVWIYPDIPDPAAVEMVVVWKHPIGSLSQFPNLRCIQSFGAGVEHVLNDPDIPKGVPIARVVQHAMTVSMRNYVGMAVLNIHKRMSFYRDRQVQRIWEQPEPVELALRVGILGLGVLGSASARFIADMGFEVKGYSQSKKAIAGVACFSAAEISVQDFVRDVNVLVCLLPFTEDTEDILNYTLFQHLPRGSYLLNAARGGHLVESDLLRALDEGILAGAYLDVFRQEPLPEAHVFWGHPDIIITPHSSSVTNAEEAVAIIAENYQRMQQGNVLLFPVQQEKGY